MNHSYLPIKIYDKKWADKLMDGEVYMRPLEEFGSWRIVERGDLGDEDMNNDFRGDIGEGVVRNLAPKQEDSFFDALPEDLKNNTISRYYIDDTEKKTRIFSMAKLEYDIVNHTYKALDKRLSEFGDTAVIILNPEEFYKRIFDFYQRVYSGTFIVEVGEVTYKNIFCDYGEWGIYVKENKFQWQNEVRIAARLREDIQSLDVGGKLQAISAKIEGMDQIAIEVPLSELLEQKWCDELMDEHIIERISKCCTAEIGITDYSFILRGNFEPIGPYEDWISYWKEKLLLYNWTPITNMECVCEGRKPVPRLAFIENGGRGKLFFHYQAIELCDEIAGKNDRELWRSLLDVLDEKFKDKYIPTECCVNINLGEVDNKYDKKIEISDRFVRWESNFCFSYGLNKAQLRYRNVFGLDCFDLRWHMYLVCSNQEKMDGRQLMETMFEKAEKTIRILKEGCDVYEQYHGCL